MTTRPNLNDFTKEEIRASLNEVRFPVDIAVYGSENYFNLGAIIRNCHNFLIRNIYAIDTTFYKKASMGTHKYENIHKLALSDFINQTMDRTHVIFERREGLSTDDLGGFVYPSEPILVFGCEKTGVPDELMEIGNHFVSIPMFGIHNDMNLAVATGIVLYDYVTKYIRSKSS